MQMLNFPSRYKPGESPYDIHKNRMSAILSIVGGIKNIILGKYTKGILNTVIGQLGSKISPNQSTEAITLLNAEPTDIYPDDEKLNTMAGQYVDYANAMGKVMKEREGMASSGMLGQPTGQPRATPTSEVMLPKGDNMQFLNAVQNMPGGTDFAPVLKYMEEHRPFFMGSFSPEEQWVMNQVMGQPSEREQYMQDIKDAETVKSYFEEPKEEKTWEDTLGEANEFIKNNPDYEISAMNPKTGSLSITKKSVKPEIDWEKVSEQVEKFGLKLTGMNVNPNTGNVSYSFSAGQTGITWEETLKKANQFMKDNPDYEVTSTNPKTGSVTIEKKGKPKPEGGELKDLTGSDIKTFDKMFYGDEENLSIVTPEDYKEVLDVVQRTKKDYPYPTYLEVMEKNIKRCLDNENKITNDDWFKIYEWLYPYYKTALEGGTPKYLPPEEIKKIGFIEGAITTGGVKRGDYGSALIEDKEGKEKDDKGYIVGETYKDEEGVLWKYLGNGKFEEIEKEKKTQKRKR